MLYKTIKHLAKSKKIPIYKIERELDISQGSICKWDKVKPSYDKICGVASILGVSVEEIVSVEDIKVIISTHTPLTECDCKTIQKNLFILYSFYYNSFND